MLQAGCLERCGRLLGGFGWWVLRLEGGVGVVFEQMMGNLAGFDGSRSRLQRLSGTAVECAYLFWTRGLETCFWTALARMLGVDRCKGFVNWGREGFCHWEPSSSGRYCIRDFGYRGIVRQRDA